MTRLAGLVVLSLVALPADASNPTRMKMEKPRPTESAEPPLALPIPPNLPPVPEQTPAVGERVREIVRSADRLLAGVVGRGSHHALDQCRSFLKGESPDLRPAWAEVHRFWMNNQPGVLTFQRLNGAVGP